MTEIDAEVSRESASEPHSGHYHIGVDVGGTFTDLVLAQPDAELVVVKVPSTPTDPAQGVLCALAKAASDLHLDTRELLTETALFVHGTTAATNTILERKGAKVGLLVSDGFRDSLEIRRGYRPDPWDHRTPYSKVLVPRYLRLPAAGRIDRHGDESEPLSAIDVAQAAERFSREEVESVAICLFNSYLSDAHEEVAARTLKTAWSGEWMSRSSRLAPIIGEYERSSTVVLNAYIAPRTVRYLKRLDKELTGLGLQTPILLIQNNGGAISIRQIDEQPATLLLSGPAAGVGALNYYASAGGFDNLISMEMGGTSCDVILMSEGQASWTDHLNIDGYHLALPSIDVHTVGAGGGTIAGVDQAGMLFVGPQGAGAQPGPACYRLGGQEPTITDTQLVLGRLSPGPYAGGAINIDEKLASDVIASHLATPLGISTEDAAVGVIRLMDQTLLNAVQRISVERGHDPARFTLVAGGGAGPLHGASVGRLLGNHQVYIPRLSGVFCALGMLNTDVRHDYFRVYFSPLVRADLSGIRRQLDQMEDAARAILSEEGFTGADMRFLPGCDLRYHGQQWDVQVLSDSKDFEPAQIKLAFETEHQRLFGHTQPDGIVEITKLRMSAVGTVSDPPEPNFMQQKGIAEPEQIRPVWIDENNGWMETPIYNGSQLGVGAQLEGPAIINEQTTTVLIGVGDQLCIDVAGNYLIRLATMDRSQ